MGKTWVDVRLFTAIVSNFRPSAFHESETYYANRQPWQVERLSEGSGRPASTS